MPKGSRRDLALVLFALPFVFLLIPQIYNRTDRQLFRIPFFVWYQRSRSSCTRT